MNAKFHEFSTSLRSDRRKEAERARLLRPAACYEALGTPAVTTAVSLAKEIVRSAAPAA